ncbi:Zinc-finger double-stranded RNA-binding [Salix suchowensis]|nr:Zinc-finger double-stranded RNA-binding [Salix suchowensis]
MGERSNERNLILSVFHVTNADILLAWFHGSTLLTTTGLELYTSRGRVNHGRRRGCHCFRLCASQEPAPSSTPANSAGTKASSDATKKGKKKKRSDASKPADQLEDESGAQSSATPAVAAFSGVIPGQFDAGLLEKQQTNSEPLSSKTKKKASKKNKKGKAKNALDNSDANLGHSLSRTPQPAAAPSSSASQSRQPSRPHKQSKTSIDTDGSWTRVETRRGKRRHAPANVNTSIPAGDPSTSFTLSHSMVDPTTSDAGVTTSVTTGNSSPVAERATEEDEDEGEPFLASIAREKPQENRRTLAEKLLPKPRKTGVDDMTETPDYPQIARVIRVQPRQMKSPHLASPGVITRTSTLIPAVLPRTTLMEKTTDGESCVEAAQLTYKIERAAGEAATVHQSVSQKAPESLTKRQRQNASRREAEKAAQAEAEADRLARLAKHKSELERTRVKEQLAGRK